MAITGVFSYPDPGLLCAITGGQGYIVDVFEPASWMHMDPIPITQTAESQPAGLLLIADFTTVTAYGSEGRRWRTARLSWDGIELSGTTAKELHGLGWNAPRDEWVEFVVDLATGTYRGGANPEDDADWIPE
jgi:hypothetical protein